MSKVRVLVGTRKGAFILTSDGKREKWEVSGPHFAGWELYHLKGSPADPNRIYASQCSGWVAVGPGWYEPKHYIPPDPTTGWIPVDPTIFTGTGFQDLLNFDTTTVVPAACPPLPSPSANPCFGNPLLGDQGGAPAGSAVVGAGLGVGTDMAIIFQATRVMVSTIDYSNSLCEIRINN